MKYEYPTTVIHPNQPVTAAYETVVPQDARNSTYVVANTSHSSADLQLEHNPAYLTPSELTDQS